jgi:DNA uptake protein ComE-like DNA-binding protein
MKSSFYRIALTAATVLLTASMAFAIEVKTPDIKGAAKANVDGAKATADKSKADVKADADKTKADTKGAADKAKAGAKAKVIDINSASEAELKAIPGIGDAYASKIVAGRPYANKAQLKSRNILPSPVYEKTKDLIIATQPKK